MKLHALSKVNERKKADVLWVPYFKTAKGAACAYGPGDLELGDLPTLKWGDFDGKQGAYVVEYPEKLPEKRLLLIGLGESDHLSVESLRKAYARCTSFCREKRWTAVNLVLPEHPTLVADDIARGVSEGVLLNNFLFDRHHAVKKKELPGLISSLGIVNAHRSALKQFQEAHALFQGVNLAKTMVNTNADEMIPQEIANVAKSIAKEHSSVTCTVFDKKRIEKEKMGLLLAVNQGSSKPPVFVILKYQGNPKSKDHTIVVGKGVTYDTGGLNLKPTGSMELMKKDMAGAATALGVIQSAAELKLKCNVTAVIPSTENCIDAMSFKPGDVYSSYSGKTVEIGNTDAEGRLILADALAYSVKNLNPTRIIDVATLTGAIIIALGHVATGLFSNNADLEKALVDAGHSTHERVWPFPLFEEYKSSLKSDIADLSNVGGRGGSSIIAALFLQEFVEGTPWAHLDIAGTSWIKEGTLYDQKHATGVGVRLLVQYLRSIA